MLTVKKRTEFRKGVKKNYCLKEKGLPISKA